MKQPFISPHDAQSRVKQILRILTGLSLAECTYLLKLVFQEAKKVSIVPPAEHPPDPKNPIDQER